MSLVTKVSRLSNIILFSSICLTFPASVIADAEKKQQEQQQEKELQQEPISTKQDQAIITIVGRAAEYYFVEESTMATKTPTDFMDLPQSIQVLSEQLISDQAARQTSDLYRSISGITQFSYSGVTARGFRQDQVRYDGVQGDPYSGFSIPQLFNIEQVEVLKGPTGMLYGAGQPGGLLNYVTKKPEFKQSSEIALITGSHDLLGTYLETTGPMTDHENFAYRMSGFYQSKEGFRNNTDEQNALVSVGVTWLVDDSFDLNLQYDFIDQDLGGHRLRGVPVDDAGNFLTDISYNPNEKTDFQRLKADIWQLTMNKTFSDQFTNRTIIRNLSNERTQNYHENRGLAADGRTMTREFRDQLRENDEWSLTSDFIYQTIASDIEHTWLFGFDYFVTNAHYESRIGRGAASLIPDIDIISPVYGADPADYLLVDRPASDNKNTRIGLYVQDQIRFNENWLAIAGFRYDKYKDKNITNAFSDSDNSISPRVGVIYQPNEASAIFANVTQGFVPQSLNNQQEAILDNDSAGKFKAETSQQFESGIKNRWLNDSLLTTVTAYHIVKNNVTLGNPDDTGPNDGFPSLLQIGEVTSSGIEIDAVGDLTENWTATANYAFNKAKITGGSPDSIINSIGNEFVNAPDHTLGLWTRRDLPSINSAIAFGLDYVSERISFSGQKVKAYTVWDLSWQSEINQIELQINIKNIFDKVYASSGFNQRNGHFPGEPRSILIQASYAF